MAEPLRHLLECMTKVTLVTSTCLLPDLDGTLVDSASGMDIRTWSE